MHWKFLLFGITGNLAKIKILPGLAEFAILNQDKVSVELIGYSRSTPKLDEVEKALNSGLKNLQNPKIAKQNYQINNKTNEQTPSQIQTPKDNSTHNLTNITFEQGSYEDGKVLFENIAKLKTEERLVVYLAVPPSTFLKFLQNACPYGDQNVDFIIEKPFGRDPIEAEKLLNLVESCGLSKQVHFCDHYLFKNSTLLSNLQRAKIQNFFEESDDEFDDKFDDKFDDIDKKSEDSKQYLGQNLEQNIRQNQNIIQTDLIKNQSNQIHKIEISKLNPVNPICNLSKIHIQILENVDLKGRSGYFDTTGALKDMWPHLFSLLFLAIENAGFESDFEVEVAEVFLGQYQSYADEEGLSNSQTETYFWIKLKIENQKNQNSNKNSTNYTEIVLESGKNLPKKITQMTLKSLQIEEKLEGKLEESQKEKNQIQKTSKILTWSIYPAESVTLNKQLTKIKTNSEANLQDNDKSETTNKTVINLKREKLDQTNLFELLLNGNKERFVQSEKIKKSWDWWQKITDFINKNQIQIIIYPDQTLPKIIDE